MLRQSLINLLSAVLHSVTRYQAQIEVNVHVAVLAEQLVLSIQARFNTRIAPLDLMAQVDNLDMAHNLVELCGGHLDAHFEPDNDIFFSARIWLPIEAPVTVLMIDDNADTRQLFQRYLAGTRYRFLGIADCYKGVTAAIEHRARLIVLDVMMPGQDGWAVLGQLREHPETRSIPVIICTILSQEKLALALGAAGFIRKPVSRDQLLAVLDHQFALLARGSC